MKTSFLLAALGLAVATMPSRAEKVSLEEVATFPTRQVTGVIVSAQGRVFVNFPFWSDDHTISVAIVDGKPKPFPDDAWNAKDGPPGDRRVCVQALSSMTRTGCGCLTRLPQRQRPWCPAAPSW